MDGTGSVAFSVGGTASGQPRAGAAATTRRPSTSSPSTAPSRAAARQARQRRSSASRRLPPMAGSRCALRVPAIAGPRCHDASGCTPAASSRSIRASSASASSVDAPCSTRRRDQPARRLRIAAVECGTPRVQQLIALALTLRDRAARAFDVGARPCMAAVDEQHARPDVDREFVLFGEIVIEPREQELFDARVSVAFRHVRRAGRGSERSGSVIVSYREEVPVIMRPTRTSHKWFHSRLATGHYRVDPERQRRPPSRGHRALGGRDPRTCRRPAARLFLRRVAQPIRVHARR